MNCQDNSRLKVPLPELCKTTDIGCVPITNGKPDCPPEADQLPIAYDPNAQTLWVFSCESRKWVPLTRFSLAELEEVSLDNFKTICDLLKVPVFYNPGQGTIEGHMSLGDFAAELVKCASLSPTPTTDSKTVVAQGENVSVTSTTDGDTTTYTVSATGGGPQDSKTVLQAGNNIEITSSTSGATTTYTVNATSPQIVDQNDITKLEAGQNITLSSVTLGNTTTYTVSATPPDDRNDITVVEAGNNTTVTSNKVGNVTTYTVSASGGGSGDGNDITVLEAGDNVNLETSKSGNTTTYTVSATGGGPEDSKTVLQAGTNISLTTNTQGATTTYTINASGGGGGVNQDIDMIDLPRTSEKEDVVFSFNDTNTYTQFAHYPSFIVRSRDNYFEVLEGNHEEVDLNQVAVGSSPWRKEITLTNPLDTAAIGKVELYIRLKAIVPIGDRGYINTPALVACITEEAEPANQASFNASTDIMRFEVGRNWGCLGKYTDHWATLGSLWDATVVDGQSFSRLRLQGSATTNVGLLGVQSELNETTPDEDNMLHIGHSVEIPANSSKKVYIQYWLWNKVAYPAEITYQFMWETEVVPKQFFNLIGGTTPTPVEDKNDITVVEAGTGVSVTSNKVGDVTTYTVNASGSVTPSLVELNHTMNDVSFDVHYEDSNTFPLGTSRYRFLQLRDNTILRALLQEYDTRTSISTSDPNFTLSSDSVIPEITLVNPLDKAISAEIYLQLEEKANSQIIGPPSSPSSTTSDKIRGSVYFILSTVRDFNFADIRYGNDSYLDLIYQTTYPITYSGEMILPDNVVYFGRSSSSTEILMSLNPNETKKLYFNVWVDATIDANSPTEYHSIFTFSYRIVYYPRYFPNYT